MEINIAQAIDQAPLNRGLSGADWLSIPGNVAVSFDNGDIALFDDEGDGTYEGHLLFTSRGKEALRHVKEAFSTMFIEYGAKLLFGLVPEDRRDVKLLLRWAGARSRGLRYTVHGFCELFILTNASWKADQ